MTLSRSASPRLSCIVTAFNEGPLAAVSLDSLLGQSFGDFEILLVDDGASEETRRVLHSYDDPRIVHIRQANDGLSSARNRALGAARGDYVCFLDSDDTRPPWAFEVMMAAAADNPDCVFSPGILQELRQETHPFYDARHFHALQAEGMTRGSEEHDAKALQRALRQLACLEPQSANKMVRRSFLERHRLRFPSGLFFEDMLFHNAILVNLESYGITELPTFTYFRRYARAQITSTGTVLRFDAISTAINTLHLFSRSRYFQDATLRTLVLGATFKMLKWSAESVSHEHKSTFEQALRSMISGLDPRYREPLDEKTLTGAAAHAPWVAPSLDYMNSFVRP